VLIILGIAAFGYQGVLWVTGHEQVAKIGPVEVQKEKSFPIPLAPILGGLGIAVGIALLVAGARRTG
jgi:hypothetical protein